MSHLEQFQGDINNPTGLVRGHSRDIDVDEHAANRRPHGLEVASPEDDPSADSGRLERGEDRASFERVFYGGLHANNNVQRLCMSWKLLVNRIIGNWIERTVIAVRTALSCDCLPSKKRESTLSCI